MGNYSKNPPIKVLLYSVLILLVVGVIISIINFIYK